MRQEILVRGIILQTAPVGEYDKRLVILTKELGRITIFARGARRMGNPFLGGSHPFSFGEFHIIEGKTAYTLTQLNILNYFQSLKENLAFVCYGTYFLEVCLYFTKENNDESDTMKLLYVSLNALEKQTNRADIGQTIETELIKNIFEWKMLVVQGISPQVFSCVKCGCHFQSKSYIFSFHDHGIICDSCRNDSGLSIESKSKEKEDMYIDESTLYTMQYIASSKFESLYNFTVSPKIQKQLNEVLKKYMSQHVERTFHSLEMIGMLNSNT